MTEQCFDNLESNIVIVDNDSYALSLMATILKKKGYLVRPSLNGQLALESIMTHPPDLILLDINMPEMSGYEVCEVLKSGEKTRSIPVIFVSGMDGVIDKVKAFSCGAVDYITKPYEIEEVLARINTHLTICRLQNQLQLQNEQLRREINEHKSTEKKLHQAIISAEKANRAKSEFLANMSHEFRTPMHAILSYSKFGIKSIDTADRKTLLHYFSGIRNAGHGLLPLLNDILDLSKLESGKMELKKEKIDIDLLIRDIIEDFKFIIRERGLKIIFNKSNAETKIFCDKNRISQVIWNLLSNAVKFTNPGRDIIILYCEILHKQHGLESKTGEVKALQVSIADQGIGIPEQELESIFDKFVQSRKTRTGAGGTGLGLAICKQIIEAHKGNIYAVCNEWGGATFTFTLPAEFCQTYLPEPEGTA